LEADLIAIYGTDLPENWREARMPSFRRLTVIVRHLPPESAVGRVLGQWPVGWDLLDDIRRASMFAIKGSADLHPDRPAAKALAAQKAAKAETRAQTIAASKAREAARQVRLAAPHEEGDP
jgi:hypothetical protein